jgi:ubiquinone/menaquinone biosynthesis C-methylase UbiE
MRRAAFRAGESPRVVLASDCRSLSLTHHPLFAGVNEPAWKKAAQFVEANIPAGGKILDIGAGPGEPTTTMARALPKHSFVTTDSQEPMVEKAKIRAQGLTNVIDFQVANAEDLAAFPDESFDAATGCYVLMFVHVTKSLTELARVLKPGGLAFFTVWREVPFYAVTKEALKQLFAKKGFKGDAPKPPVNPMSLSPTEDGVSSVEAGLEAMKVQSLKVKKFETISYEFKTHTAMEQSCELSTILLPGVFAKIAEDNATTEAQVKAEYCLIFEELVNAKPDWKNNDGTYSFGHSVAGVYILEKAGSKNEL